MEGESERGGDKERKEAKKNRGGFRGEERTL